MAKKTRPKHPKQCSKHPRAIQVEREAGPPVCMGCFVSTLPKNEQQGWFPVGGDDDY